MIQTTSEAVAAAALAQAPAAPCAEHHLEVGRPRQGVGGQQPASQPHEPRAEPADGGVELLDREPRDTATYVLRGGILDRPGAPFGRDDDRDGAGLHQKSQRRARRGPRFRPPR